MSIGKNEKKTSLRHKVYTRYKRNISFGINRENKKAKIVKVII